MNISDIVQESKLNSRPTFRYISFRLLIDKKHEINVFQIKNNKAIYLFTNFIIFLCYFIPFFFLIVSIVFRCLNMGVNNEMYFHIACGTSSLFVFLFTGICKPGIKMILEVRWQNAFTNIAYLVHSKYLIDKYLYFYNVDLSELMENSLNKYFEHYGFFTGLVEHLKEKDKEKLKLINNIKNFGIINKIYLKDKDKDKDKDKAINLMKWNIQFFLKLTNWVWFYIIPISAISAMISFIP